MNAKSTHSAQSQAESLFAGLLAREGSNEKEFEALCAQHPTRAEELHRLHSDWQRLAELRNRLGFDRPISERLAPQFEGAALVAVELPGHEPREESAPSAELIGRLESQRPGSGRYRVLGEFARGGMGSISRVWDPDLRRTLAMKVAHSARLGSARADPRMLNRFLEEAQITAQLDHTGIVPVHELGLDDSGRVYFTMRLVHGRELGQIFQLAQRNDEGWNVTRALNVLLRVCEAVGYAHQKGVIHRDLKPANVMVGDFGEVYVMDWGLARVVGKADRHDLRIRNEATHGDAGQLARSDLTDAPQVNTDRREFAKAEPNSPLVTMDGVAIGTPAYMPPEQATGKVESIGVRSDVYSIGAMLYQLLAGEIPYLAPGKATWPFAVLARVIEGPPRSIDSIRPNVAPELVAICEHAMARDPAERYADTSALAEDLRAFLEQRVVTAYRSGALIELRLWVRRNRALAASLVGAMALGLAGVGAFAWSQAEGRRGAETALGIADQRARELQQVADFQSAMLSQVDPLRMGLSLHADLTAESLRAFERAQLEPEVVAERGTELEVLLTGLDFTAAAVRGLQRHLLTPSIEAAEREFATQPLVLAQLLESIASALGKLGLARESLAPQERAVELRSAHLGATDPLTLVSTGLLGTHWNEVGEFERAEKFELAAVDGLRASVGTADPRTLTAIHNLGAHRMVRGQLVEAEVLLREAAEGSERALGPEHEDHQSMVMDLGLCLRVMDRLDEAEPLLIQALESSKRRHGDGDGRSVAAGAEVGLLLRARGKLSEAETYLRAAVAGARLGLSNEHPQTLMMIEQLAQVLRSRGELAEAELLLREAVAGRRRQHGNAYIGTLDAIFALSSLLVDRGTLDEGGSLLDEAIAGYRALGNVNPNIYASLNELAILLMNRGRNAEAEPYAREAYEGYSAALSPTHSFTVSVLANLGLSLQNQGKLEEAEETLGKAYAGLCEAKSEDHPTTLKVRGNLALVQMDLGRLAEAEEHLRAALEGQRAQLGEGHEDTLTTTINLGRVIQRQGRPEEAEPLLRLAMEGMRAKLGDSHRSSIIAINNYAVLLSDLGRLEQAEPLSLLASDKSLELFGAGSKEAVDRAHSHGLLLQRMGRGLEAAEILTQTVADLRRLNGTDDLRSLKEASNLGRLLQSLARFDEAEPMLKEVVAGWSRARGPDSREAIVALGDLGLLLHARGKSADAVDRLREALIASRNALGPDDPQTLTSANNLGMVLRAAGRFEEAQAALVEAAEGLARSFGTDSPDALAARGNLCGLYRMQKMIAEAESCYREVIEGLRRSQGAGHADTVTTCALLAELLIADERARDAVTLLAEIESHLPQLQPSVRRRVWTALAQAHEALAGPEPDGGHVERAADYRKRAEETDR